MPQNKAERVSMMAQWVKALDAKPDDLSSVPGIHIIEGENQLLEVVLWLPHVYCGMHTPTYIHMYT